MLALGTIVVGVGLLLIRASGRRRQTWLAEAVVHDILISPMVSQIARLMNVVGAKSFDASQDR
jgi:hypothetical protein